MSHGLPAVRATTVKDCTTVLTLWTPTAALEAALFTPLLQIEVTEPKPWSRLRSHS